MPRLLVVQHLEREGPGLFAHAAADRGWDLRLFRPDRGEALPEPGPGDLLLVLGGPMGVDQIGDPSYPWLQAEVALLERVLGQERPVIGVCLGAQLLAHAAGGRVEPLVFGPSGTPVREVGWGAVSFSRTAAEEPLLRGLDPSEVVLHWHGDRIRLPAGATLLASSLLCREQMFRLGTPAVGLQFHVELLPGDLERWLLEDGAYVEEALGAGAGDRLLEEAARWGDRARLQGRRLVDNLLAAMEPLV